jgi:hypothetical protein
MVEAAPGVRSFTYTVNPGGQVQDGVVVVNHGAAPVNVPLRATGKGVGEWIHLDRADVTVGPGESTKMPFTLATCPCRCAV